MFWGLGGGGGGGGGGGDLVANIVASRVHLEKLRAPLLIDANQHGHHRQGPHRSLLHESVPSVSEIQCLTKGCEIEQKVPGMHHEQCMVLGRATFAVRGPQ